MTQLGPTVLACLPMMLVPWHEGHIRECLPALLQKDLFIICYCCLLAVNYVATIMEPKQEEVSLIAPGTGQHKRKSSCLEDSDGYEDVRTPGIDRPKRGVKYFWSGHSRLDFLTNSYESLFDVDGVTFKSVSWYMWYMRAKVFSPQTDLAVLIREAANQDKAKQLSRRCASANSEVSTMWMTTRLKVMAKAVMKKFECSPELSRRLLETGQDKLLYSSRYDAFYGIGFTMKESIGRVDEWGKNYLGEMLMLVRKRVKERGNA